MEKEKEVKPKTKYKCKGCGVPVIISSGEVIRICSCNTTVIAECESGIHGQAGVNL